MKGGKTFLPYSTRFNEYESEINELKCTDKSCWSVGVRTRDVQKSRAWRRRFNQLGSLKLYKQQSFFEGLPRLPSSFMLSEDSFRRNQFDRDQKYIN